MRVFLFSILFSLSFQSIANAQVSVPSNLLRAIVFDLKKQGFPSGIFKKPQLVGGIIKYNGKLCSPNGLQYQKNSQTIKGVDRPLKDQYWVSANGRKTMLLVKKSKGTYVPYGALTILERIDTYTYKVREVYCQCSDCVVKEPNGTVRILQCELQAANTPAGFACKGDKRANCRLVERISYFCGRFIYE